MCTLLVAFYFMCLLPEQGWPVVIGPYETWDDCASVREFLDRRGYETASCAVMTWPQEQSQLLQVGDLPKSEKGIP